MQSSRTIQFWDGFYEEEGKRFKEWIRHPTEPLLRRIASCVTGNGSSYRILEIGCGTFTLARDLFEYLEASSPCNDDDGSTQVHVTATDVSSVCLDVVRERDADVIERSGGRLDYKLLNITEQQRSNDFGFGFDMILDKGCLDTILFRSKSRGPYQAYNPIVRTVLDNIHSWLAAETGVYVVLSPRTKLKALRDYRGFDRVERHLLADDVQPADLEGDDNNNEQQPIYLYVSHKDASFSPPEEGDDAFAMDKQLPKGEEQCPVCQMSFISFRKGEHIWGRGGAYWIRRWRGHCSHCTG